MREHLLTTVLFSAIIGSSLLISAYHSQALAARSSITKLQTDGFKKCKSIDRQGKSAWTGVAKGTTNSGGGRGGFRGFNIRSCFTSKSQCQQFINNITRIVYNVDTVKYKRCSPR